MAAIPPLMSQEPRPHIRPSSIRGRNGSIVMPSVGTVSWWTSNSKVRREPGDSNFANRLSRPGATGCRRQVIPLSPEPILEVAGQPCLEHLGAGQCPAHRVDARDRHQVCQQARQVVHGSTSLAFT